MDDKGELKGQTEARRGLEFRKQAPFAYIFERISPVLSKYPDIHVRKSQYNNNRNSEIQAFFPFAIDQSARFMELEIALDYDLGRPQRALITIHPRPGENLYFFKNIDEDKTEHLVPVALFLTTLFLNKDGHIISRPFTNNIVGSNNPSQGLLQAIGPRGASMWEESRKRALEILADPEETKKYLAYATTLDSTKDGAWNLLQRFTSEDGAQSLLQSAIATWSEVYDENRFPQFVRDFVAKGLQDTSQQ